MKINHKKKAITLIETIISLALIMVLIIPISSMVMGVINTGRNSENKQKAITLGQQITEEIKALNSIEIIDTQGEKYINLLNGKLDLVEKDSSFYKFAGENYNDSRFNLEVYFNKNIEQNSQETRKDIEELKVEYDNSSLVLKDKNERKLPLFDKLTIEVKEENNKREITFHSGDKESGSKFIIEVDEKRKIAIKFAENLNRPMNIDIYNDGEESFDLYVMKHKDSTIDININTIEGIVRNYKSTYSHSSDKANKIGDLYDIDIKVIKNNENIFINDFKHNIILKSDRLD
ncbi:hypothetical protein [Clostridium sp.]|uniref:hypothetical protein n=1 Tax=Clostridium sp. TaxID=1506 RepID=UPI003F3E761F